MRWLAVISCTSLAVENRGNFNTYVVAGWTNLVNTTGAGFFLSSSRGSINGEGTAVAHQYTQFSPQPGTISIQSAFPVVSLTRFRGQVVGSDTG